MVYQAPTKPNVQTASHIAITANDYQWQNIIQRDFWKLPEAEQNRRRNIAKEFKLPPVAQDIHLFCGAHNYQYFVDIYGNEDSMPSLHEWRVLKDLGIDKEARARAKESDRKAAKTFLNQGRAAIRGSFTPIAKYHMFLDKALLNDVWRRVSRKLKPRKNYPVTESAIEAVLNELDLSVALAPHLAGHYFELRERQKRSTLDKAERDLFKRARIAAYGTDSVVPEELLTNELLNYLGSAIEAHTKKKFPMTEAEVTKALTQMEYAIMLAPMIIERMTAKARHQDHKYKATMTKDYAHSKGKSFKGTCRTARGNRRLLLWLKGLDIRKAKPGRWTLLTFTTDRDMKVKSYIPLASKMFNFLQDQLGDVIFGASRVEYEHGRRHIHMLLYIPEEVTAGFSQNNEITEQMLEVWGELAYEYWAEEIVSKHTDHYGNPVRALDQGQDFELIHGPDGSQDALSRVIHYVCKKARYVKNLREEGQDEHADRVEKKCSLNDQEIRLLNGTRECPIVDDYLEKTGKDTRGPALPPNIQFANLKSPGEHQFTIHNKAAASDYVTVETISLDQEEYLESQKHVLDKCDKVLAAKGSSFRMPRNPYRVYLSVTMLTNAQVRQCIEKAKQIVRERRRLQALRL